MRRIIVEDIFDIAYTMHDCAFVKKKDVCAILFFEQAEALMRELLQYECVSVGALEIENGMFNDYDSEYMVTLTSSLELFVEKILVKDDNGEDKYLHFEADKVFVDGRASYAVVTAQTNDDCEFFELVFTDEDEVEDGEHEEPAKEKVEEKKDDDSASKDCKAGDALDALFDVLELMLDVLGKD